MVRIRPQIFPHEPVENLIEDPWKVIACEADQAGCQVEFEDEDFVAGGRETLYYVRAIQEATNMINAANVRCEAVDAREALKQLPEDTQQIFSLHFDQGMTHPEIVVATGLPLGTIKTRLRRGLIEVRNILAKADSQPQPAAPNS